MFKTIYLDMDGVLSDFDSRYFERYGHYPFNVPRGGHWVNNWTDFIQTEQFKTLDWVPSGLEFYNTVQTVVANYNAWVVTPIEIQILSSSGGNTFHSEVTTQKQHWLDEQGIKIKANIVPGRSKKKEWAQPTAILIDDMPSNVDQFVLKDGYAILHDHKNHWDTIAQLEKMLRKAL